jgi:hypothetical protein
MRFSTMVFGALAMTASLVSAQNAVARVQVKNGFWTLTLDQNLAAGSIVVTTGASATQGGKTLTKKGDYSVLDASKGNYNFFCSGLAKSDAAIYFKLTHSASSGYLAVKAEMVDTAGAFSSYKGDIKRFTPIAVSHGASEMQPTDWSSCFSSNDLGNALLLIKAKDLDAVSD